MKNYYKIGEISKLYNIGLDSLRYYEKIGILNPKRGPNNYRQYSTGDIYRLNIIKDMRHLGFSMDKVIDYIQNRSIDHTLKMFEEEIVMIDQKINELNQMKKSMLLRYDALKQAKTLEFDQFQIQYIPPRKCVTLKEDIIEDDNVDFLLTKLSKEYEKNLFVIANFNTGCFIDMKDNYQYKSVVILGETLESYEYMMEGGYYLTLTYQGKRQQSFQYLQKMNDYICNHGYQSDHKALELLLIDTHETSYSDEYMTQLQIKLEGYQ